jgi:hypothetical protein
MVLALAILLSVFLMLFGIILLISLDRDLSFETRRENQARAQYLALSGIEYHQDNVLPPAFADLGRIHITATEAFEVNGTIDGTIQSVGLLLNTHGHILARKTIFVPHGLRNNRRAH